MSVEKKKKIVPKSAINQRAVHLLSLYDECCVVLS